jgi:hypothetical protein
MTRKETLAAVRAAGMVATYDADAGEYRVTFPASEMDAERREAVACYTSDGDDALGSARAMRAHADAHA